MLSNSVHLEKIKHAATCPASTHLLLLYLLAGTPWTSGQAANPRIPKKNEGNEAGVPRENPCREKDHSNYTEKPLVPGRFDPMTILLWGNPCLATATAERQRLHYYRPSTAIFVTICVHSVKKRTAKNYFKFLKEQDESYLLLQLNQGMFQI